MTDITLLGVDFTSAPRKKKPISCAWGILTTDTLSLNGFESCESFEGFGSLLTREPAWIGGFDMPFGLPREFVIEQGWPPSWLGYTKAALALSRQELVARCRAYAAKRPPGQKLAYRATDKPARSSSAMWWMNPPVVLMYHAGIGCLLDAKVRIEPCRRSKSQRIAVEAYPGLLQKRFAIGSYKQDLVAKQTPEQRENRVRFLLKLAEFTPQVLGVACKLHSSHRRAMMDDPTGDTLDAFVCLVQAAYAAKRREMNFGFPVSAPANEGWIVMA
jgi:Protein of unknown function (DUF429)